MNKKGNILGWSSIIIGIIVPIIGIIISIAGFIQSKHSEDIKERKSIKRVSVAGFIISILVLTLDIFGYVLLAYIIPNGISITHYSEQKLVRSYCEDYIQNNTEEMTKYFIADDNITNKNVYTNYTFGKPEIKQVNFSTKGDSYIKDYIEEENQKFYIRYNKHFTDYTPFYVQIPYSDSKGNAGYLQASIAVIKCNNKLYLLYEPDFINTQEPI